MSQDVQPYRQPEATPVGHSGTRVDIQERPAWAISGWFGVLVVAACIAGADPPRRQLGRGDRRRAGRGRR